MFTIFFFKFPPECHPSSFGSQKCQRSNNNSKYSCSVKYSSLHFFNNTPFIHEIIYLLTRVSFEAITFFFLCVCVFLQNLKDVLADLIPKEQTRIKSFKQQYGKTNIGQITVDMVSNTEALYSITCKWIIAVGEIGTSWTPCHKSCGPSAAMFMEWRHVLFHFV